MSSGESSAGYPRKNNVCVLASQSASRIEYPSSVVWYRIPVCNSSNCCCCPTSNTNAAQSTCPTTGATTRHRNRSITIILAGVTCVILIGHLTTSPSLNRPAVQQRGFFIPCDAQPFRNIPPQE